jgi:hypothetical protein
VYYDLKEGNQWDRILKLWELDLTKVKSCGLDIRTCQRELEELRIV